MRRASYVYAYYKRYQKQEIEYTDNNNSFYKNSFTGASIVVSWNNVNNEMKIIFKNWKRCNATINQNV